MDTHQHASIPGSAAQGGSCPACHVATGGRATFLVRGREGLLAKCTRCSLLDRALFRRSALVAAIVGTALVALNQGDALAAGTFPWAASWYKVPLTYLVPFCVATYGALANGYRPPDAGTTSPRDRDSLQ
jgi:hypothetical protein